MVWPAIEYLLGEWRVIASAPVIASTALLLSCFAGWAIGRHQFADRLRSLKERSDTTAERLKARDDEIERLKAAAPPTSPVPTRLDLFEKAASRDVGMVLVASEITEFGSSAAAEELAERLRRAGWSVNTAWVGSDGQRSPSGIEVTVGACPSPAAISLLAALSAADLTHDLKLSGADKTDAIIHVFRRTF